MGTKKVFKFAVIALCLILLPLSESTAAVVNGGACTKLNAKRVVSGYNFKCIKSGNRLVWKRISKVKAENGNVAPLKALPSSTPSLEIYWEGMSLILKVVTPSQTLMQAESISSVKTRVKFGSVSVSASDSEYKTTQGSQTINFTWDLSPLWNSFKLASWPIVAEAELTNALGSGPTVKKELEIPLVPIGPTPTPTPTSTNSPRPTPTPSGTSSGTPSPTPSSTSGSTANETVNQFNARRAATNYLSILSFSRAGLIKQLEFDGFSRAEAEYAVNAQKVNWKEQAAKTAAAYIKLMAFSYASLLSQLVYEGYTQEEAEFGVDSTGLTRSSSGTSPTPKPTQSSGQGSNPNVCQVAPSTTLPFGNQRITVTNISWEKDSSGYVSALFTIRNDNSINLRLVQFTFYILSNKSIINLAQTLQGDNFFIKDDAKFNSVDGQTGAWLPGQTRVFRLPTNEILDCSSISYSASAFRVLQGIGDN